MKSLDLIAWAWPLEVAALVAYACAAAPLLPVDRYELFLKALPLLTVLIGAQGGAAYFGKAEK